MLSAVYLPYNCGGIYIGGVQKETSLLQVFKRGSKQPWGGGFYRYQRSAPLWILSNLIEKDWQLYKDIKAKKDRHWHLLPVGKKFFAFRLMMREKGWNKAFLGAEPLSYGSCSQKDWEGIRYLYGFFHPSVESVKSKLFVSEPTIILGCISLHVADPPETRRPNDGQLMAGVALRKAGFRMVYFDNPIHSHVLGLFWKVVEPCKKKEEVAAPAAKKKTSTSGRRLNLGARVYGGGIAR